MDQDHETQLDSFLIDEVEYWIGLNDFSQEGIIKSFLHPEKIKIKHN